MKLSISNIAWKSMDDQIIYHMMKAYGYFGLELAPTRVFPQRPYERQIEAKEWAGCLQMEYGFAVSSMQSIWFGRQENMFGTKEERQALLDYTKKAIDFAEMIGCKNLVFGCPKNRNLENEKKAASAVSFFRELGDYAAMHHTVIGMEANPEIYHTNFINHTSEALDLIEAVDSAGFLLNLDTGTMIQNQECLDELAGRVNRISHVHISEPELKPIQKRKLHLELRELLEKENYQGFISIEMGQADTKSVETAMQYVKGVFA